MGSFLGPSNKGNATVLTEYTQVDVQTSAQGLPIPIGWGTFRVAANLIDTGFFNAIPLNSSGKGGGGKGGAIGKGSGAVTQYDYQAMVVMALCEGPIQGLGNVYVNQSVFLYGSGLPPSVTSIPDVVFSGQIDQAAWGFLLANEPSHALSYSQTAYVADSALDMGAAPVIPDIGWEVIGRFTNTMPDFPKDANPADIINDLLTNPQYNVGFGPSVGTTGSFIDGNSWTIYKSYCQAQGILLSPVLDTQEQLGTILKRWADLTNTWMFWSSGVLKFVPLGDTSITAYGGVYTVDSTPIFNLGYADVIFEKGQPPFTITRVDPADAYNYLRLEIRPRDYYYDAFPVEFKDQDLVDKFGQLNAPTVEAHDICDPLFGAVAVQLLGQRYAYIRNTWSFKVGWELGCVLEPGDLITVSDPHIGTLEPVRIRQLDEDDKGNWAVIAEEFPGGITGAIGTGTAIGTQIQPIGNPTLISQFNEAGNINPPAIFEPQSTFTGGVAQIWLSASGGANWGGANVFLSFDNVSFHLIGSLYNPARQGMLTAPLALHSDPDTIDTLSVDLSESLGNLSGDVSTSDADLDRTLCFITDQFTTDCPSTGELLSYGTSTAVGPYAFNLTYLRRGQVGTTPSSWIVGDFFTRLDIGQTLNAARSLSLLTYDLPIAYISMTLYIKFQSFNRYGNLLQDISEVVTYTYTPNGNGHGGGGGGKPTMPTGLSATPEIGGVLLSWNANPASDNLIFYKIYRASGLSASFSSANVITTTTSLGWVDTGLAAGSQWTYFLVATNAVGDSVPTAGVNATVLSTVQNAWYQVFSVGGKFTDLILDTWDNNYEIFDVQVPVDIIFGANFGGSPTPGCEIAPSANVTLTFQTIHAGVATTVGTLSIVSTSTTGSYSVAGGFTLPSGDRLRCYAPSAVDSTISGFFGTIVGSR